MAKCKFFYGNQAVSPKGTSNWNYINTRVNVVSGEEKGFGTTLAFSAADTDELLKKLKGIYEDAKESEEGKELIWKGEPHLSSEDNEGNTVFKFKRTRKDENGEWQKIPLVDAHNKPLPLETDIGTGSVLRAIYQPAAYWVNKSNSGVTLFLEKIQVVELKKFSGGSGSSVDFPTEDNGSSVDFPSDDDII